MINPNAVMATATVQDQWARDNFVKLNRVLNGDFQNVSGQITLPLINLSSAALKLVFNFTRVGNCITLMTPVEATYSKANTLAPQTTTPLPSLLLPKRTINVFGVFNNNAALGIGDIEIRNDGYIFWGSGTVSWVAASPTTLYCTSFSYVGN